MRRGTHRVMAMLGASSISKRFMSKTRNRVFADMSSYLGLLRSPSNY